MAPKDGFYDGFGALLDKAIYNALSKIGLDASNKLKDNLESAGGVASDRLKDSITFTTDQIVAKRQGAAKDEDMLEKPTEKYTLLVGTACPYGRYYEFGTGPHSGHGSGGEEFKKNMFEWGKRKGYSDDTINAIMEHIKKHGTKAHPFFYQSVMAIRSGASIILKEQIGRMLQTIAPEKQEIVIEVPLEISMMR